MKRISLLIITLMFSSTTRSQQTSISDWVSFALPKSAKKLTGEELKRVHQPSATIDYRRLPIIDKNGKGDFYLVKGILIYLNAGEKKCSPDYLEEVQNGLKAMETLLSPLPPDYHSQINKYSDFSVLVINKNEGKLVESYSFFCLDKSNTIHFNGIMDFYKTEKKTASKTLDCILKTLRFNEGGDSNKT